ncbi:hypothetical protein [Schleiferia thermophila]|uniref:hypothetical protein n=1 Tax=Schleiferia thermophila TaxID=884107 RepID=UPI001268D60D|nr:hypothetical protein [Schleiferia thermophila]
MKILKILLLNSMILIVNGCNAQTDKDDKPILMLKDFYTAYSKVIFKFEDSSKVDSLLEKYCTPQLREKAKKYLEYGHDLLTDDWGFSEESLTSLIVVKGAKENEYTVSYIVDTYPVAPNKPVKKQVVLFITVVKEGENYKIDSIR